MSGTGRTPLGLLEGSLAGLLHFTCLASAWALDCPALLSANASMSWLGAEWRRSECPGRRLGDRPGARPPALGPAVTHGPVGSAESPGLCAAFGPGRRSSQAGPQHHPLPGPPGGRSQGGRWALGCPASVGHGPATRGQTWGPEPRAAGLRIPRLLQTRPISAYPRTLAACASVGLRTARVISGQP